MAAGSWLTTTTSKTKLSDGASYAIGVDTFKMALLDSTSNIGSGSTTFAGVTGELATANGYTAGGQTVVLSKSGTTTVTWTFPAVTWTPTSGNTITARYAVIYESGGDVLFYCLLDSTPANVSATFPQLLTVTPNASGLLTY